MTGILFILLSVACSLLIAHFLKMLETRGLDTLRVLTVNYFVAVIAALGINLVNGAGFLPDFPLWLYGLSAFVGFIFIANFFIFSKSTHQNGVGVSVAAMRLSLLLPVIISVVLFNEEVTLLRGMGFFLVLVSLTLLVASRKGFRLGAVNSHWLLIGIFLFTGIGDASMKVFEQKGLAGGTEAHYMAVVFFSALVAGLVTSGVRNNIRFTKPEIKMGVLIGIPNLLTSIFLIRALMHADGVFVYPAVNVLIIIGGALVGKLYWDDRISRLEAGGMIMAIMAILFLL